jgi:hypothetical protein
MRQDMKVLTAITLCIGIASTSAQAKPDFSGVWVEDEALRQTTHMADRGQKAGALPSRPIAIQQTAVTIRIEHEAPFPGWKGRRYVYDLAGKESVNHNGANTLTTKSRWDGNRLVVEGVSFSETSQGEFTWKYREVRWLDAKSRMIVETRTTDESGTTLVVTQTYDKKK